MVENNSPVLDCFWLPPNYYHTCISGANQNTIAKYGKSSGENHYSHDYFQQVTLPSIRNKIIPYPKNQKYLKKSKQYCAGFREVVNDALNEIYKGRRGYVFNTEQLIEIIKFIPDVDVIKDDGMYYVSKRKC